VGFQKKKISFRRSIRQSYTKHRDGIGRFAVYILDASHWQAKFGLRKLSLFWLGLLGLNGLQ